MLRWWVDGELSSTVEFGVLVVGLCFVEIALENRIVDLKLEKVSGHLLVGLLKDPQ